MSARPLTAFLILLTAFSVTAQTPEQEKLDNLQKKRDAATSKAGALEQSRQSVQNDIKALQTDLTRLGAEINTLQARENMLESELSRLRTEADRLESRIFSDHKSLSKILAGLQRIEVSPPPALAIRPQDAVGSARAARLMASLNAQLSDQVTALREDLENLGFLRAEIGAERAAIAGTQEKLAVRQTALRRSIKRKADLEQKLGTDLAATRERADRLAAEADTLKELIRKLETRARSIVPRIKPGSATDLSPAGIVPRLKPGRSAGTLPLPGPPPDTLRFADARGHLQAPSNGHVTRTYSAAHQGYTVVTGSEAQITAPYTARIEFAGKFKNYGKVVIMNMGDGYFMLMTGLGEVLTQTGSYVTTGEPVGLMPFNAQNRSELYIEIRRDGSPVNPRPWLGTAFAKHG